MGKGTLVLIYLDNAATTQPSREVIDAMINVMRNNWGNPSAQYTIADNARKIIEDARKLIADDIGADPEEIIFTSGACEANSLAIQGYISRHNTHWWTTRMEHASIHKMPNAKFIENDEFGFVKFNPIFIKNLQAFQKIERPLISIGAANGEIGTIQDLKIISKAAHECNCVFHTDATQLFPEMRINVKDLGIDMMSVSAQKFNGPRGAGFLYVKKGVELNPIIYGGQENELRGGTYNTAAIAGMAVALTSIRSSWSYIKSYRNKLLNNLLQIEDTKLNGAPVGPNRLANNINITIDGVNAEKLVTLCSMCGLYIGKGSACQSYDPQPSHVLIAIGLSKEEALNTIRITVGNNNTESDIEKASEIITKMVKTIR